MLSDSWGEEEIVILWRTPRSCSRRRRQRRPWSRVSCPRSPRFMQFLTRSDRFGFCLKFFVLFIFWPRLKCWDSSTTLPRKWNTYFLLKSRPNSRPDMGLSVETRAQHKECIAFLWVDGICHWRGFTCLQGPTIWTADKVNFAFIFFSSNMYLPYRSKLIYNKFWQMCWGNACLNYHLPETAVDFEFPWPNFCYLHPMSQRI